MGSLVLSALQACPRQTHRVVEFALQLFLGQNMGPIR